MAALARAAGRFPDSTFFGEIARLATGQVREPVEILTAIRTAPHTIPVSDPVATAWLAYVALSRDDFDVDDVATLFRHAITASESVTFPEKVASVAVQVLQSAGTDPNRYRAALSKAEPDRWWAARVDTLNPYLKGTTPPVSGKSTSDWLEAFNEPFIADNLAPLQLIDRQGNPFDRLVGHAPEAPTARQPLVSVIMPVFNPDGSLSAAVRSLLNQSWASLEVIICDDSSTTGKEWIDECAELDERVQVVRRGRNGGAYAARNLGLQHANGDFVAFNDADDWSHPQRIEIQVSQMVQNEALMATLSHALRVTDQLSLTNPGQPVSKLNFSSLMIRRKEVLSALGGFDNLRRGADSEFLLRLTAVFGSEAVLEIERQLALVQLTPGSLSRGDFRFLRTHPARRSYRTNLRHWHTMVAAGTQSPFVIPEARARFPAHAHMNGKAEPGREFDLLVLANLTDHSPSSPDITAEIQTLSHMGLDIGLVERHSLFDLAEPIAMVPGGGVAHAIWKGSASLVHPGDRACGTVAVVRDPAAALAAREGTFSGLSIDTVLIVADYSLGEQFYDVDQIVNEISSAKVYWQPTTASLSDELRQYVPLGRVLRPRLWGVTGHPPTVRRARLPGGAWGLASQGSDQPLERLQGFVPTKPDVVRRTWGVRVKGPHVRIPRSEVSREEFLGTVDYLAVPNPLGRGGHLNRLTTRGLRRGCAVIMDGSNRDHYGDAVTYADDVSMDDLIHDHRAHPESYWAQVDRGFRFLETHMSQEAFMETVRAALEEVDGLGTFGHHSTR